MGHLEGSWGGRSGEGGLYDEFSSELRELGWWALLGELGVCGGRRWYPGSDWGSPGEGTPGEERQESGQKPSSGSGAGEEVKRPGCQGRDVGGEEAPERKAGPQRVPSAQGSEERRPQGVVPRVDGAASSPEPRPAWKLCLAGLKLQTTTETENQDSPISQPLSWVGPLPRPAPLPLALGLSFVVRFLMSFWCHRTASAAGPACAASVHVSLLPRDQV